MSGKAAKRRYRVRHIGLMWLMFLFSYDRSELASWAVVFYCFGLALGLRDPDLDPGLSPAVALAPAWGLSIMMG